MREEEEFTTKDTEGTETENVRNRDYRRLR
jgi:hypothetical protein